MANSGDREFVCCVVALWGLSMRSTARWVAFVLENLQEHHSPCTPEPPTHPLLSTQVLYSCVQARSLTRLLAMRRRELDLEGLLYRPKESLAQPRLQSP